MNKLGFAATAALALTVVGVAKADEPVQVAQTGSAAAASGAYYVRADASYQSLDLPAVDLGYTRLVFPAAGPNNANGGPLAHFKPTVTGHGTSGAFGYIFPNGTLPASLGANARIELGGSYMDATDSQSDFTTILPSVIPGEGFAFQHVTGALSFFAFCATATPCPINTTLRTHYEAWHANVKGASDFGMGSVTLTPSLVAFGGAARNDQALSQLVTRTPTFFQTLTITASEKSTDLFGSKVGLKAKIDVAPWLALGVGGDLGLVDRRISLVAYDNSNASGIRPTFKAGNEVTAFLAGAEASVIVKPVSNVAIKLFGGATYDDHVAGIASPTYTGVLFFSNPTTPARIKTAGEIGYYAGLGVVVKFGL